MTTQASTDSHALSRLAIANIAVAGIVVVIKFAAYFISGSAALFSDAAESLVNIATALAAFYAIYVSAKPADADHPFGHHKAEFLAAMFEGAMIAVAAVLILIKAFIALRDGVNLQNPNVALAISIVAAAINATWARHMMARARAAKSEALLADGQHLMSDVATSVGVVIGLGLAIFTGQYWLDPLLAAVVALHILWIGYDLLMRAMSRLLDQAASPEIEGRIRGVIESNGHGALQAHDIRTRQAGRALFIEFHLVVPGSMTVDEAHIICDRLEDAIERHIDGSEVVIHVEPGHKAKSEERGAVTI